MFEQSIEPGRAGEMPLVRCAFRAPFAAADEAAYLAFLERFGALPGPFLSLFVLDGDGKLTREGERAQALWFKATRAHLDDACRGMAVVRREVSEHMRTTFGRLWRFPLFFTTDEAEAETWLAVRREMRA